ncbi:AAA family ATPase [Solobacterium moorei]|uniref:AAA family ATPase n=1 Tax=Solobacterium moorei TaxID=102148 RepID=UPI0003FBA16F|nr:AAA family ATPase [Solobacterium moorei]BET22567.1 hypothetical protein RGT18_21550 [Solobacterium moorei]
MGTYKEELHSNYQKSVQAFIRVYPHILPDTITLIDNYCRTCAMYLWNSFSIDINTCKECLNVIFAEDYKKRVFTVNQVKAAMSKLSERQYSMPVPAFFKKIIENDLKDGTNYSRKLASCFGLVFISFALIDGTVEYEEAKMITKLHGDLVKACDEHHIIAYDDSIDPFDFVDDTDDVISPIISAAPNATTTRTNSESKQKSEKSTQPSSSKKSPFDELSQLIGLSAAKMEVKEISDFAKVQKARKTRGLPISEMSYHLVFTGNPGTGKTTVARLVAQIYKELGILSKGHLVEATAKDLVAGYVGQTAIKTGEIIEKALGGVLFIDEAYTLLDKTGQGYGQEAIDTLLKEMEDHRGDFAVIVAGYDDLMKQFIESNPGLKSRFNKFIHFEDYTSEEMMGIFNSLCAKNAYTVTDDASEIIKQYFVAICESHDESFANARTARNFFENVISKQASRIASKREKTEEILSTITADDVSWCQDTEHEEETLEDILATFNELTGLELVKEEISDLIYVVQHQQRRKAQGLKVPSLSLHLVFMGNPGTGKTTVARYVAKLYKSLGLLSKGHLVETDRSGLVAGYVGQTAIKTQEVINSALGGVLFIDEAYTLSNGGANDFGQEAIDTLLKAMEDKRDDLVVIVAGYDELMDDFVHSNPGLESRFNRYIHFSDYSTEEMYNIFGSLCQKNQYELSEDATTAVKDYFSSVSIADIGNGRGARNLFERVVTQQAKRISKNSESSSQELSVITETDVFKAIKKG